MYRIDTPSPYEENEFTIPKVYSSSRPIDWINDLDAVEWLVVQKKAMEVVLKKHSKKGGIVSTYELYYTFSIKNGKEYLVPVNYIHNLQTYEMTSEYWRNLIKNPKIKIIFIPLSIINKDTDDNHANMIIIDKRRKCVEFFDPHGGVVSHNSEHLMALFKYLYICGSYLENYCFIPENYRLKKYDISCPSRGFQLWEIEYGLYNPYPDMGYCMFWTIFLLDLRLSNLSFETDFVQKKYIQTSLRENDRDYRKLGEKFRKFIIEYSNYWGENFGRRNPKRTCRR